MVNKATLEIRAKNAAKTRKSQKLKVNMIPIRPNFLLPATT